MTIKTSHRGQWRCSGVFIVIFEIIPHLVLVFLLRSLSKHWFALYELFYISIVFRFDGFRFYLFLERIPTKWNISTKWNAQGADLNQWNGKWTSIKFLWWNLNYELTALITNELHNFFNLNSVLFNFFMNWASNVAYVLLNTYKHHHVETLLYLGY